MNKPALAASFPDDCYPSRIHGAPQVLERVDPVVYGKETDGILDAEQLASYERDGFLHIESLFGEDEVSVMLEEVEHMKKQALVCSPTQGFTDQPGGNNAPLKSDARDAIPGEYVIREPASRETRSFFYVHAYNALFQALGREKRIVDIARQILGSEVYIHQSRVNLKPGFRGKEFHWHSDFETWHVEDGMPRMRALSCSIALADNYEFNGPLMVIPGSHRHYIACVGETPDDHYKESLRKQEYGVPDEGVVTRIAQDYGIRVPKGKAGSVVFFDCNLLHGSNSNITPYPRTNAFFVYNSVENALEAPFGKTTPRPEFVATRNDFAAIAPMRLKEALTK